MAVSGEGTLRLPVRRHGIELGRPVDLIVDAPSGRALGFDVLCGDDVHRFLPVAAAQLGEEEIAVGSSLMLLEDVIVSRDGSVAELVVANGSGLERLRIDDALALS